MTIAIETKNLTKVFRSGFLQKKMTALSELNLSVEAGTIFGFLGPNGAGKTTTLKLLTGLIHPTSGEAFIFGRPIQDLSVKKKLGFLPERPYFYEHLTGLELLHFCGELFGMSYQSRVKKIEELLKLVQLKGSEQTQLRRYSKGMLQRIGLAQSLINDPQMVILDEPMSGLDPIGRKTVRDIILHLKALGKTVFFSTHILSDAEVICDQIAILIKGKLRSQGKIETLLNPKTKSVEICLRDVPQEKIPEIKMISSSVTIHDTSILITVDNESGLEKCITWARREEREIVSIIPRRESLEDLFMEEIKDV